jgi:hypothetical protein
MPKSNGLPSGGGRMNGAQIVDVVRRRSAVRLARITFVVVVCTLIPTTFVVASTITDLWLAAAIGIGGGLAVAIVASLLVLIWPVLRMIWWWSGELALLAVLLAAYWGLSLVVPWPWAVLITCTVLGGLLIHPRSWRWLERWVWCAISRHRLRTCFALFVRANRYGSLPLILLAKPTPAGERVWVVLRPGLALEDLTTEGGLARFAVGAWADQVRLTRASRRFSPLIRVDITRRNPLAKTVNSPLTALVPNLGTDLGNDNQEPVDPASLDLPGVPVPPTPAYAGNGINGTYAATSPPRRGRPAPTADRPATRVVTSNGDDLSEWV